MSDKVGKNNGKPRRAAPTKTGGRRAAREPQPACLGLSIAGPHPAARRLHDGIQLLVRRFAISERADVNCCGLTVAQAATLDALSTQGPLRLSALGRRLGITPSTLTRNIDRLEEAGFVARKTERNDARASTVALTRAGREAASQVEKREEAFAHSVLERVPAERRDAVLNGLCDLLVAVREATESCCPGAFDHLMTDFPASSAGADAMQGGQNDCPCE